MLYQKLKETVRFCKLTTKQDEINIRCMYCGDSVKDQFKGHMYIQNKPPYKYFCQRCQSSGVVNAKFLEMLSIEDYALINNINVEYEKYKKKVKIKYGAQLNFLKDKQVIFPGCRVTDLNKKKYLENRLGIILSDNDVEKYKIVYNLSDFLSQNKINIDTSKNYYLKLQVEKINKYCVGFLSYDKSTIIFRSLDDSATGFRYNNFTIFPELESKKTYIIKNTVDLSSEVFDVVITEGILDIIGVYNHIYNKHDSSNTLFIANAGKSFIVTANLLKKLSILNCNIYIYSDSDVSLDEYKKIMNSEPFFALNGINIFYNNIGKDYGVSKDKIKLSRKIEL